MASDLLVLEQNLLIMETALALQLRLVGLLLLQVLEKQVALHRA